MVWTLYFGHVILNSAAVLYLYYHFARRSILITIQCFSFIPAMVINQKAANVWTARVIPLILIGIVCYASFVIIGPLCSQYIHPSNDKPYQRPD